MGRATRGVRGIKLMEDDQGVGMDIIDKSHEVDLLTIMEKGLGKKTSSRLFRGQSRGGQGVKVAKVTTKTGKVVFAQVVPDNCNEMIFSSERGQIVKIEVTSIPKLSRNTQGVILMRFSNPNDRVAAATYIDED
ncbi:MAG: hypothetical protein COX78_01175 [Candidatus Levybacteria bacterium CG_4_10_14_0_2_um_filter_35_8]|nr:MAG: hypothetical protein COX78_01175 [Candidatus Levybacteria bacterium CG_4_10_14_0_2_um_filter_35_8]